MEKKYQYYTGKKKQKKHNTHSEQTHIIFGKSWDIDQIDTLAHLYETTDSADLA